MSDTKGEQNAIDALTPEMLTEVANASIEEQGNEYWLKSWECVMGHASNDGGSEEEVESAHAVFLDRDDMPDLVTNR